MSAKTIAVIFGGKSTEHDVSIVSAIGSVIKPLEAAGQYNVIAIYIAKDGTWYSDDRLKDLSLYSSGKIDSFLKKIQPIKIQLVNNVFSLFFTKKLRSQVAVRIDVIFPAMHGTFGEDGSLMGMLRMAGVPFVGCDMEASVVSMNKLLSHQVVEASGVKSHPYIGMKQYEYQLDKDTALHRFQRLSYPLFVKPVHLGSSIGISRVTKKDHLKKAIDLVFSYDDSVIVEEAVPNLIEVTVPIMGTVDGPICGLVERPLFDADTLFDFDKKYIQQGKGKSGGQKVSSGSQGYSELPAKISHELYKKSEKLAVQAFQAVGCEGLARVDLLINKKTGEVYFNEINPMPGSLYAHNWRAAGVSTVELVSRLIELALKRADRQATFATSFSTNFLKQF